MASAPFVFADLRFTDFAREFRALSLNALKANENRPKVNPRFFERAPRDIHIWWLFRRDFEGW